MTVWPTLQKKLGFKNIHNKQWIIDVTELKVSLEKKLVIK